MIKKYTEQEYAQKAWEATAQKKTLYIYTHKEEVIIPEEDIPEEEILEEEKVEEEGESRIVIVEVAELVIADEGYYICYDRNYTDGTLNSNYEKEKIQRRKQQFETDFFETSLGWIRRKVTMASGEKKDFLTDLLPIILNAQQSVKIITYLKPDFTQDIINWESLQVSKQTTIQFLQECSEQVSKDFYDKDYI